MRSKKKQKKIRKPDEIIPAQKPSLPVLKKKTPIAPVLDKTTALQSYLSRLTRYPLLTKEEEYKLTVQFYETRDSKIAEQLIQSNLRFVVKVAREYSRFSSRIMDLIQEGNIGLVRAVQEFNPYKGVRLITYAVWWIRGYIQEYLIRHHSIVHIGTSKKQRKLFYLLQREKEKLENLQETKLLPALAGQTNTSIKEVEKLKQTVLQKDVSLDQPVLRGSLLDLQKKEDENMEETFSDLQQKNLLQKELKKMTGEFNEKEMEVLHNRLLKSQPETLQAIAERFNVTKEAIRQVEERLLKKLREKLRPILKKPY
ncbi:MAG: sigma-70 family RNA polymerase sigma factor [Bdellovibrionales bacterium]|nr:sigma-70 family RNA polymerase sigma factor [Bdellovibrionales bacterium]